MAVFTCKFIPERQRRSSRQLADVELHFNGGGVLDGLKLVGFGIWERRNFGGRNVTFPARHVQRQRRAQVVRAQANRRCGRAGSAAGRDPDCLSGVRGANQ